MNSLIANYGSDSESDSDNRDETDSKDTKRSANIPTATTANTTATEKRKRDGPVKIVVDLPKAVKDGDGEEDDSEEDEGIKKKAKTSTGSSGLFAFLPAPKKSSATDSESKAEKITTTSFVPYKLTAKKTNTTSSSSTSTSIPTTTSKSLPPSTSKSPKPIQNEFIEPEIQPDSFFSFGVDNEEAEEQDTKGYGQEDNQHTEEYPSAMPGPSLPAPHPSSYYSYANYQESYDQYYGQYGQEWDPNMHQQQQEVESGSGSGSGMDEELLKKLGHRSRDGPIEIKDVARPVLSKYEQEELRKRTAAMEPSYASKFKLTGSAKRTGSLSSLISLAKTREKQLEEEHENRRASKMQSKARYGF